MLGSIGATVGRFAFGRGSTRVEIVFAVLMASFAVVVAAWFLTRAELPMLWWQWIIVALAAFDIGGGIVVNATAAAAREYHRPDQPWAPAVFAAGHIHPFVLAVLLPGLNIASAVSIYFAGLAGVLITMFSPDDLRRPASLFATAVAISVVALTSSEGWEWLGPMLMIKLIAAHATLSLQEQTTAAGDGKR